MGYGKSLFVGNLDYKAESEDLLNWATSHGYDVEAARVINDRDTGKSRGFGFITLKSGDLAKAAEDLNGRTFMGRDVRVNEAEDKPQSQSARR